MTSIKRLDDRPAPNRASKGFALLEVLIALLIFMFGVLGMVGLQAAMMRVQSEAKYRGDAAELANEVTGRMWADLANIASYDGAGCEALEQCKAWQSKVGNQLPAGESELSVEDEGEVSVTIRWTLPNGQSHRYVTTTTMTAKERE